MRLSRIHLSSLLLLLAAAACDDSAVAPWSVNTFAAQDSLRHFRTDAAAYSLTTTNLGTEGRVGVTLTNRSGRTMYFVNCNGATSLSIQHLDGARWSGFWSPVLRDCLSPPITVPDGGTHFFDIRIFAGKAGSNVHPQFGAAPRTGVYRVIWHDVYFTYQPRLPWGEPVPESQRVSNTFHLVVP